MARNTAVRVLDDLTGEAAGETVGFALDGIDYDIDLSFANAETLRALLQRYADAGRRTGGRKRQPRIVPGAKKPRAKAAPKTAKPVAGRRTAAAAAPAKARATKAAPKTAAAPAKARTTKAAAKAAAPAKTTTRAKTTAAKAEPARAWKVAEPKKTTRASARKVPTVTFSAAE
ncbi:histone-like nucleoid-structuring protein Lsr2 [Amycolatopsis sp., V23-08]|uniref:Histone-like nucleoid-structuring protein Lsr2 n=1 Tax=Amycolatopsis heterodermiae TaxID=3110235 RepID=A0ABU5RJF6_9PSEU|nr:histone-like nucleoid-structuring protein Lsr2 [Amycolatopsis sp., V23-08]MEA5366422.1 histone-like nucleoid-structuring protein Lsr2 [Amycolatopsis sp., V23-08]